jgi:hypothetical protein
MLFNVATESYQKLKILLSVKLGQATCLSKDTGCENKDICLLLTRKMPVKFMKEIYC